MLVLVLLCQASAAQVLQKGATVNVSCKGSSYQLSVKSILRYTLQAALGRNFAGQRFGPRPLDLDIIFYNDQNLEHDRLCIPHPRWRERDFVKAPLLDLFSPEEELDQAPWRGLAQRLSAVREAWESDRGAVQCLLNSSLVQSCLCLKAFLLL